MTEQQAREALVEFGRSLFLRGYSCGTSGNLSVRLPGDGGFLMSPTNVSLGRLDVDTISRLDVDGRHVDGAAPTKEAWLHLAMYAARPQDHAVVHLHSTHAAALSCRSDLTPDDAVPPLTPYVIMRVGRVALVPYSRPGDTTPAEAIRQLACGAPGRAAGQPRAGRRRPRSSRRRCRRPRSWRKRRGSSSCSRAAAPAAQPRADRGRAARLRPARSGRRRDGRGSRTMRLTESAITHTLCAANPRLDRDTSGVGMRQFQIAVFPGDGIGVEVIQPCLRLARRGHRADRGLRAALRLLRSGRRALSAHRRSPAGGGAAGGRNGRRHPARRDGTARRALSRWHRGGAAPRFPRSFRALCRRAAGPGAGRRPDAAGRSAGVANRLRPDPRIDGRACSRPAR